MSIQNITRHGQGSSWYCERARGSFLRIQVYEQRKDPNKQQANNMIG